jgi:hypothetical protein
MDIIMQLLFIIHHRHELFQVKSLTWLLDGTLLVGDSTDTPGEWHRDDVSSVYSS